MSPGGREGRKGFRSLLSCDQCKDRQNGTCVQVLSLTIVSQSQEKQLFFANENGKSDYYVMTRRASENNQVLAPQAEFPR